MNRFPRRASGTLAVAVAALVAIGAAPPPSASAHAVRQAGAQRPDGTPDRKPVPQPDRSTVAPGDRDRLLPPNWRTSSDLAWTTAGDSTGFHLLVADSRSGYSWRTVATLVEPSIESDQWVGNACLTASGKRAVVVYEPRHFTNRAHLFDRGAFAAVVDIASGRVTKLDVTVSIAYHNPGCGASETAVLTQAGAADLGRTRLHLLDTTRVRVSRSHELPGQVTSAVPLDSGIAAAQGNRIVSVGATGRVTTLANTRSVAAYLRPDAGGGLAFLEPEGEAVAVARRVEDGRTTELARGPLTDLGLARGTGGRVFLTGTPTRVGTLPAGVARVAAPAVAELSTLGRLAVTHTAPAPGTPLAGPSAKAAAEPAADEGWSVGLRGTVVASGRGVDFQVTPGARPVAALDQGRRPAPALISPGGQLRAQAAGSPTEPVDDDRYCSVPRNDVRTQVEQPHWRQVEWAADQAVRGALTLTRPTNWRESGLSAWSPQSMYPPIALAGGGRVPAQVLLGILAQESNMWQTSWHALEGVPGNPLIGNYYGVRDLWGINWAEADCGYGVAQVTDGMRLAGHAKPGEVLRPANEQRAIAVDYATNIAAGLRILQDKWNQTWNANIRINNADPSRPENWFAAVWAYNSGLNPQATTGNTTGCTPGPSCADSRGNWGLGWGNNPANPDYPYNRTPFLNGTNGTGSPTDASHPQHWPYPEKIMGWAAFPIVKSDFRNGTWDAGYLQAWWSTETARTAAIKPPLTTFCTTANNCSVNPAGQGRCGYSDYHCWWHWPASWKSTCDEDCGYENLRFEVGDPEPPRGTHYPPVCTTNGLPAGALIVDDVPDAVGIVRSDACGSPTTNNGRFTWQFSGTTSGLYPSKRDLHQIGSGIDGHFWFSHEYDGATETANKVKITGTWELDRRLDAWTRVFVHMPKQGGESQQAHYTVDRGVDATPAATRFKTRTLHQRQGTNAWVPLGVFDFRGTPRVSLSNITRNGGGGVDNVAWDAIAFQVLPGKPRDFVVALGESYSSGEGAAANAELDYYYSSNNSGDDNPSYRNGCHRSRYAWSRQAFLATDPMQRTIGQRADERDKDMDYHLLACSGAESEHLLPSGTNPISGKVVNDPTTGLPFVNYWGDAARGSRREVSQLDMGYLDENTTLVTLSIGGNDAHWSAAIQNCIQLPVDCRLTPINGQPAAVYVPDVINNGMRASVATVLRAIGQVAPNAKIILMGYPELMSDAGSCMRVPIFGYGITVEEAVWMNAMAYEMGRVLREVAVAAAASGIRVRFADPIANGDFAGEGICGDPETIHGIVVGLTAGEDRDLPISQQSFHPKISGAANYAGTLDRELRNWGL